MSRYGFSFFFLGCNQREKEKAKREEFATLCLKNIQTFREEIEKIAAKLNYWDEQTEQIEKEINIKKEQAKRTYKKSTAFRNIRTKLKMLIKSKKRIESRYDKEADRSMQFEELIMKIEELKSNQTHKDVLVSTRNMMMKSLGRKAVIDADSVFDDITQSIQKMNDVTSILSSPMDKEQEILDEDDIEMEVDQLLNDEISVEDLSYRRKNAQNNVRMYSNNNVFTEEPDDHNELEEEEEQEQQEEDKETESVLVMTKPTISPIGSRRRKEEKRQLLAG